MQWLKLDPGNLQGHSTAADDTADATAKPKHFPFSWGAFSFPGLWLMFHDQFGWGALVILFTVVVNGICWFAPRYVSPEQQSAGITILVFLAAYWTLAIVLGIKGSSIAWAEGIYSTVEDMSKSERRWTLIGLAFAVLIIWMDIRFVLQILSLMRTSDLQNDF